MRAMKLSRTFALLSTGLVLWGCSDASKGGGSASAVAEKPSASSSAAAAPKKDSATITKKFPAVGDKTISTKNKASEMEIALEKPKAATIKTTENEVEVRSEECLAVDGNKCSKVKVTYTKLEEKKTTDGKEKEGKKPHAGKTYTVEWKDGKPVVTADGKDPPKEEAEAVAKDFKEYYKRADALASLPDSVAVGDSLDGLAKVLASQPPDSDVKDAKVDAKAKVSAIKEEGGKKTIVVDLTVNMSGTEPTGGQIKADLTGTMTFLADSGWVISIETKGPVSAMFDGKGKAGIVGKANGTITEKSTAEY